MSGSPDVERRSETFKEEWVSKLLSDMKDRNINYGVLITTSMPKDYNKNQDGYADGIEPPDGGLITDSSEDIDPETGHYFIPIIKLLYRLI